MGNLFIYSRSAVDREALLALARERGSVHSASTPEQAIELLRSHSFESILIDVEEAIRPPFPDLIRSHPLVFLCGRDARKLQAALREGPAAAIVDYLLLSDRPEDADRSRRVLGWAAECVRLKGEVSDLARSKAAADNRLRRVYEEIKGLGSALSEGLTRELEKRMELEHRYQCFQTLKRRFEEILRKLYAANDVSNLLDLLPEIKEIVAAGSVSLYLLEEGDAQGPYLKPLVWDNEFLTHADFSRVSTLLSEQDFAATAARNGLEIVLDDASRDPRQSRRYREHFRTPLRNLVALPLKSETGVIGVLEVANKAGTGKSFSDEDIRILRGLSEHITLAMTKLNLIQYDALTGLLRPDPFYDKVIQKIEQYSKRRRETGSFAMVMGDVDWFKHYNDRNGHEAGNRLLRELATVLKSVIREDDVLCRYGGEEFLFFLTGVNNIEESTLLSERIRKTVEEHFFEFQDFQPRGNLTMSFGVTLLPREPMGRMATKTLLKGIAGEADLALAEAKGKRQSALGLDDKRVYKNRVCAYVRDKAAVFSKTAILRTFEGQDATVIEKRQHPRFFVATLCIYRDNNGHRVAPTVDLSLGGVRISADTPFPLSRKIDLFLVLGSQAHALTGEVMHSEKPSPESAFYHTGLRFVDPAPEDRLHLLEYIESVQNKDTPLA